MRKKLYDIPIEAPLTDQKRQALDLVIAGNAHLAKGTSVSHAWDAQNDNLLNIRTPPVVWEIFFHSDKVEVFGTGPGWVSLLFTKKRQQELRELLEGVLASTGFYSQNA